MQFGNWKVTENGIKGLDKMKRYEISKEDLTIIIDEYIDKLINITEKDGMTEEEVFNLNMAYMYALGKFNIESVTEIHMQNTSNRQRTILNDQ